MSQEEFTEQVVVLKLGQFKESDLWVRIFSPSRGVMQAFAFGGLRSRRRFGGCLEPLSLVAFSIARNPRRGYFFLREGSLLNRFANLHRDLTRMGMAVNCIKFLEAAHIGSPDAASAFCLLLETLKLLNDSHPVPSNLPLFFRCSLACRYGYEPDLKRCSLCGRDIGPGEPGSFHLEKGLLSCRSCAGKDETGIPLAGSSLQLMTDILHGDPRSWTDLEVSLDEERQACRILDRFVRYHTGLVWEAGRFRHM